MIVRTLKVILAILKLLKFNISTVQIGSGIFKM